MLRRDLSTFTVTVIVFALVACSGRSPVEPGTSPGQSPPGQSPPGQIVSGSYQLAFFKNGPSGLESVSSLPFGQELILRAHVEDSSGLPAKAGTVIFEYCSLNGFPKDDITQIDEAPIEACANGSATWTPLVTIGVNGSGEALMNFGFVRVTPVIGFRFRYLDQGSGIASGTSAPANFMFHP
jgi:hypothetical protein